MRSLPPQLPSVLSLGMVSQVAQVVLLRELLMVFHGNELSIGVILAAWLAWVGIGSALGAWLAGRRERVLPVLLANAAILLPLLLLTVFAVRGLRGWFDVLPGAYLSLGDIFLASFTVMAPVCLLLGMQFVLLAKLWRLELAAADMGAAGRTYIGEAAGSVLGGLAFTFFMVRQLDAFQSVALAGMLMLAAALWAGRTIKQHHAPLSRTARASALLLLVAAAGTLPFLGQLDSLANTRYWQQLAPDHVLVETHRSRYGTIAIARRDDQYSVFQSGHLLFATAGSDTPAPHFETQEAAVLAHLAMAQHPDPRRVLLLGGGLRGTLAEIVRHPVERIDYVELDEVLVGATRPFVAPATRSALADPRVRLVLGDGRVFVKQAEARYDIVIVDVPDPATAVLNRFYTAEFYRELNRLLAPGGVVVTGADSTAGLRGTAVANRNATLRHTLGAAFPEVLAVGDRFLVFVASGSEGVLSADPVELERRFTQREVHSEAFTPRQFHLLFEETRLRRVNWILRHHGRSAAVPDQAPAPPPLRPPSLAEQRAGEAGLPPVNARFFLNSDFRPIGYFHTLLFWGDLTRAGGAEALGRLLHVRGWWFLPAAGLALLVLFALRLAAARRGGSADRQLAVGLAVFTTGLSTMALQVALLFSFQAIYGFVYEMIGLVIALFMAGLACGTAATQRFVRDKANSDVLAAVQGGVAVLALLVALLLPRAAGVDSAAGIFALFATLTFVSGVLNGLDFPLAAECFRRLNRRAEHSAGLVYGVELCGACVGAAMASVVLAPILGIVACCLLAAGANATAVAGLLLTRRRNGHQVAFAA